jgi:hypothetical protein
MDKPTLASVLMGVEDDPITKRGMLWPRVERQSGKAELGWPSFLHEPWEALKRLQSGSYRPGQPDAGWWDDQGAGDAATLAGALITGGLGLNWAGVIPKGAVGSAGAKLPTQKGITAYHGSPHDFDKFDMSKIGSGEGAQAYGHGLYFAENEGVARAYRDNLSHPARPLMGVGDRTPIAHIDGKPFEPGNYEITTITQKHHNPQELAAELRQYVQKNGDNPYSSAEDAQKIISAIEQGRYSDGSLGKMYEVRINADPESFLDWDKPLKGQPANDKIRAYVDEIKKLGLEDDYKDFLSAAEMTGMPGEWFARAATNGMKNATPALSADLKAAGIPGIKYLDQGSRAGGEGTRNYVVFDADKIEILKKYGWVPAGMVGGGMMMTPPDGQEGF